MDPSAAPWRVLESPLHRQRWRSPEAPGADRRSTAPARPLSSRRSRSAAAIGAVVLAVAAFLLRVGSTGSGHRPGGWRRSLAPIRGGRERTADRPRRALAGAGEGSWSWRSSVPSAKPGVFRLPAGSRVGDWSRPPAATAPGGHRAGEPRTEPRGPPDGRRSGQGPEPRRCRVVDERHGRPAAAARARRAAATQAPRPWSTSTGRRRRNWRHCPGSGRSPPARSSRRARSRPFTAVDDLRTRKLVGRQDVREAQGPRVGPLRWRAAA